MNKVDRIIRCFALLLTFTLTFYSCERDESLPADNELTDTPVSDSLDMQVLIDTIYIQNGEIPTIKKGFFGQVLRWQGDFMPGDSITGTITPVNNQIFVYNKLLSADIFNARLDSRFWNFYYIDSLQADPLYVIYPNDSGYYQIELDSGDYSVLLKLNDSELFINEMILADDNLQIGPLNIKSDTLIKKNLNIDYEASW